MYGRENRGRQGLLLKPLGGLPPRAGPGLPRGVDRAVKEVSGLPPARGTSETSAACWQARVLIKTWAARPARHRRALSLIHI